MLNRSTKPHEPKLYISDILKAKHLPISEAASAPLASPSSPTGSSAQMTLFLSNPHPSKPPPPQQASHIGNIQLSDSKTFHLKIILLCGVGFLMSLSLSVISKQNTISTK
jgi:hypothetical protein